MASPGSPQTAVAAPSDPDALPTAHGLEALVRQAAARRGIRIAAVVGALASALSLLAYFLPWIVVPEPQREQVRAVFEPELESLARRSPEDAERYRRLFAQVTAEGTLTGLDLFLYARSAYALNRTYRGEPGERHERERPWVIQRAFRAAALVLAALPVVSVLLVLGLVLGRLRRAGAFVLTSLVLAGCAGCALALAWLRVAESVYSDMLLGFGMKIGLTASVAQACAGLFGVTTRNWWRVYASALLVLGGATAMLYAYVGWGWGT